MRDVVLSRGVTMYQSLQFVPAVLLARLLSLPALEINAIWHVWRESLCRWPSTAFSSIGCDGLRQPRYLCNRNVTRLRCPDSRAFFTQALRLSQAAVNQLPILYDGQDLLGQWRFVDPAVGMPFFLLHVFFVESAVETPRGRKLSIAASISSALLFYLWFYYWTAAVGALLIAFILDRSARRVYATTLGSCVIAGLPAILVGLITKSLLKQEALSRIGFFASVPRLGYFLLPKVALSVLLITAVWIWCKPNRQGLYLWCVAFAALALSNNHIISGMDLREGHWRYIWGTSLSMLVLVMLVQLSLNRFRTLRLTVVVVASVVLLIEFTSGMALRIIEVKRSLNTQVVLDAYKKFMFQGLLRAQQLFPLNAVVGGSEEFCNLASIVNGVRPLAGYAAFLSLGIGDREWESREALNAYLEGFSEQEFRNEADDMRRDYGWGESADPRKGAIVAAGMMQEFARVASDPRLAIETFGVRYVAIQTTRIDPYYLKHGWSLIEAGPYWRIWERISDELPPVTGSLSPLRKPPVIGTGMRRTYKATDIRTSP